MKTLPDVAGQNTHLSFSQVSKSLGMNSQSGLQWVGMSHIHMPVNVGEQTLPAWVSAYVNLKPSTSRGIHMSRLYRLLTDRLGHETLSWELLQSLAQDFITSQEGISDQARLQIQTQWPLARLALKSELRGWRLYPVEMEVVTGKDQPQLSLTVEVLYSSTCPASTALSREVWKESFQQKFKEDTLEAASVVGWMDSFQGMPATPHAQRSKARVQVILSPLSKLKPEELINGLEEVLTTPVQTMVKRVDEQEFARLNGQNPMFCEDAARRVQSWLEARKDVLGYRGHFEHQESLHPHNAVAEICK